MVKVIPTLTGFFGEKDNLPDATKMIINTSEFFQNNWLLVLTGLVVAYIGLSIWKKTR